VSGADDDPSLAGVGIPRHAHVVVCLALAAVVLVTVQVVEPVTPILVVLITASALAGFLRPDGILAAGLIIGLSIPALHLAATVVGVELAQPSEPSGTIGAMSLAFLVIPALIAAVMGGFARRTLEEERRRPR
jgi:multisubunit Na+/H+ antiporter MnhB subunit